MAAVLFANCKKCDNSEFSVDGRRLCTIKHIDCSVREGNKPCSYFEQSGKVVPDKTYSVTMSAIGKCIVKAKSVEEARAKADWCDCDIISTRIDSYQQL